MPTLHATEVVVEVGVPEVQRCPPHQWVLDKTSYGICSLCPEERQFDRGQPSQDDSRSLAVPSTALAQTKQRLPAIEPWDPFRPISTDVLAHIIQGIPRQKEAPNALSQELLRFRKRVGNNVSLPPPLTDKEFQAIIAQEKQRELPTLFLPSPAVEPKALPG